MNLLKLLNNIENYIVVHDKKIIKNKTEKNNLLNKIDIKSLSLNSKNKNKSGIFFAISGTKVDGEYYVDEAISNGAICVITTKILEKNILQIIVDDIRKTMAIISANFNNNPQLKLKIIGITGTNGKTSTSYIIAQMLKYLGKKVGIIGTSGIFIDNKKYPAKLTTPDSIELFKIFADMVKNNIEFCVMEVSAHAIHFNKIFGINFAVKVLTNAKTDHLDFFKTKENYHKIKSSFFENGNNFVINGDDKLGKLIIKKHIDKNIVSVGYQSNNTIKIINKNLSLHSSKFYIKYKQKKYFIDTNLIGKFNCQNITASIATLLLLNFPISIISKLNDNFQILGRFSCFFYKNNSNIIIDYAHTTDSLKNLLLTTNNISKNDNIIIFGAPGERETEKRFQMGKLANKFCKKIIITSDNPATENPRRIAFEIMSGALNKKIIFIENRKYAIKKAFSQNIKNTSILIVGKGNEDFQIIGDKKIKYSDFNEIKKYLIKK